MRFGKTAIDYTARERRLMRFMPVGWSLVADPGSRGWEVRAWRAWTDNEVKVQRHTRAQALAAMIRAARAAEHRMRAAV